MHDANSKVQKSNRVAQTKQTLLLITHEIDRFQYILVYQDF